MRNLSSLFLLVGTLVAFTFSSLSDAGELSSVFYLKTCPNVHNIVKNITWNRVSANRTLAAKLLRMQFHDCFVRGCDASVLLDSTNGNTAEKDAVPNGSLQGFDVIGEIKGKLEQVCPKTVSCADIIALAARDAVSFQFGKPMWSVWTGRRDGRVSLASEASSDLPSPGANFTTLKQQFSDNGLNVSDLVALSGGHTIGVAHCVIFARRLFNFTGKGDTDPSLDPAYAAKLKAECGNPPSRTTTMDMDTGSGQNFDSHYFVALANNQTVFPSDAALLSDPQAAVFARIYQNFSVFLARFAQSMKKMGEIGVLTGTDGEIRNDCRVVN